MCTCTVCTLPLVQQIVELPDTWLNEDGTWPLHANTEVRVEFEGVEARLGSLLLQSQTTREPTVSICCSLDQKSSSINCNSLLIRASATRKAIAW